MRRKGGRKRGEGDSLAGTEYDRDAARAELSEQGADLLDVFLWDRLLVFSVRGREGVRELAIGLAE